MSHGAKDGCCGGGGCGGQSKGKEQGKCHSKCHSTDATSTAANKTDDSAHMVCPHCNAINRVPQARLGQQPQCGQCKKALFDGHPAELTAANFDRHISRNDIPVVVDFWAPWCGPCRAMAPTFTQAAKDLEPKVRLVKVNTEAEQALAARFNIKSIPTLAIFKNGRMVAQQAGALSLPMLKQWIQGHIR